MTLLRQHGAFHVSPIPRPREEAHLGPQDLQICAWPQLDFLSLFFRRGREATHLATKVAQARKVDASTHFDVLASSILGVRMIAASRPFLILARCLCVIK
jgi:hypothetical protein